MEARCRQGRDWSYSWDLDFQLILDCLSPASCRTGYFGVSPPLEEELREAFISQRISSFWHEVFGWTGSRTRPALEDHFRGSDMAAQILATISAWFTGPRSSGPFAE